MGLPHMDLLDPFGQVLLLYKSGLSLKVQPNNQDHLFKPINCIIPFL